MYFSVNGEPGHYSPFPPAIIHLPNAHRVTRTVRQLPFSAPSRHTYNVNSSGEPAIPLHLKSFTNKKRKETGKLHETGAGARVGGGKTKKMRIFPNSHTLTKLTAENQKKKSDYSTISATASSGFYRPFLAHPLTDSFSSPVQFGVAHLQLQATGASIKSEQPSDGEGRIPKSCNVNLTCARAINFSETVHTYHRF